MISLHTNLRMLLVLFALTVFSAVESYATPGDRDLAFGVGGAVVLDLGLGEDETANSAVLDSTGKIIIAGQIGDDVLVVRLGTTGTVDTTFGEDYDSDGTPDGYFRLDFGGHETAHQVLLDSMDQIMVVGETDYPGAVFVGPVMFSFRLLQDGLIDTSYAQGFGDPSYPVGVQLPCDYHEAFAAAIDVNDNLYLLGFIDIFPLILSAAYTGLDVNGIGISGINCLNYSPSNYVLASSGGEIAQQGSDGKLIHMGDSGNDFYVARYDPLVPGFDLTYGTDGNGMTVVDPLLVTGNPFTIISPSDLSLDREPNSLHYDKAVVAGSVQGNFLLARFDLNGVLDTSFNGTGIQEIDLGGSEWGKAVGIDKNGKIVMAGTSDGDLAVIRVKKNGRKNTQFGNNARVIENLGFGNIAVNDLLVYKRNFKILVVGTAFNNSDILLVRYLGL